MVSTWADFFIAQVGASAALAGLVFVGVSINLPKIMAIAGLPGRAGEAIIVLVAVLVESSLLLVPGQSITLLGVEILLVAVLTWVIAILVQWNVLAKLEMQYRRLYLRHLLLSQFTMLILTIAGVAVLLRGAGGIYWLIPGILLCYLVALTESWVLLIEINR